MTDIVERLRMWPAADGKDGLSGQFVEALMVEAAAEIERLRACVSSLQQALAQAADAVELQEAEQRGFERGRAYGQSREQAMQELADQAQALDMGYGSADGQSTKESG